VGWWAVQSPPGRVWQAIRENERRVIALGLNPYAYKLASFVLSGFLAAGAGVVYLFLQGGANPQITTSSFTLVLLVMVVLGGVGTLWGAVIGGIVYEYLDFRLVEVSNASLVQSLPPLLRVPLSEPLFILGVLFIVLVLFLPEGLGGLLERLPRRLPGPSG
jgi:branched-chain amino acid transport system permease protein